MEVDVQKLKDLREERVLSQRELARMANLAQGTVWRIEKGFSEVSPEETRHFLEAARGDRLEALYVLAVTTGMRQGELLGLKWQDVDLAA